MDACPDVWIVRACVLQADQAWVWNAASSGVFVTLPE
jgi:hypothetical protein